MTLYAVWKVWSVQSTLVEESGVRLSRLNVCLQGDVQTGVLQWSILGPLLFNIRFYASDLFVGNQEGHMQNERPLPTWRGIKMVEAGGDEK